MRVSVPGNILLLGEYAVLEEGGLGLAMAVERRVQISARPAEGLSVEGSWPGSALSWTPRAPSASPLVSAAVDAVARWLGDAGRQRPAWSTHISVDSSAFFLSDGRKSGLGSSAAVTVGLVCALLGAVVRRDTMPAGTVPLLALQAHRAAQGGAGSGYDVTCSFYGGCGVFRGGAAPGWEPCRLSWDPSVALFPGPAPVSTPEAVRRYTKWKQGSPGAAKEFLDESNHCVRAFVRAPSPGEAARRLRDCARLGIAIGDAIGVPARISVPPGLDSEVCKALGAGNELGACLFSSESPAPPEQAGVQRIPLSKGGVTWEE